MSFSLQNDGGTYPGRMIQRCGGVGRNHADALTRLGIDVHLISVVGDDSHAEFVRSRCKHMVRFFNHSNLKYINLP